MIQIVCSLAFFALFSWAALAGRRRQILRNAGVDRHGSRGEEWSAEAISAVLSAMDPALVGVRAGDTSAYDASAKQIFEALPQREQLDREAFDLLVARSLRVVVRGLPTERETRRVAERLWQMHAAAHRRWEQV